MPPKTSYPHCLQIQLRTRPTRHFHARPLEGSCDRPIMETQTIRVRLIRIKDRLNRGAISLRSRVKAMTSYKVKFFKNLLSSDGHRFKCLQQTIEIHRARSMDRAVQAAERRYARFHLVPDWKLYADTFEVVSGDETVDYRSSHGKHGQVPRRHHGICQYTGA